MNKYSFVFECRLVNKGLIDEDFEITIKANGLVSAKDEIDKILKEQWGWVTMRIYKNEEMRSEKYWEVYLKSIEVLPVSPTK